MQRRRVAAALGIALICGVAPAPPAGAVRLTCSVFPKNNVWNSRVDRLPVHARSAAYVAAIGTSAHVHADFGSGSWDGGPIGIPYVVVSGSQRKVDVAFEVDDESDRVRYPIPRSAPIEGGAQSDGDRHVIVVDNGHCRLYELYDAWPKANGTWDAYAGAVFDLRSNRLRPETWTSADAAGLPIFPGLVRYDEVLRGEIRHAIRFTAPITQQRVRVACRGTTRSSRRRRGPATDGHSLPPPRRLRHQQLPEAGARDPDGDAALRRRARRQRLAVVHLGSARCALEQRRAPPAAPDPRFGVRGGRRLEADGSQGQCESRHRDPSAVSQYGIVPPSTGNMPGDAVAGIGGEQHGYRADLLDGVRPLDGRLLRRTCRPSPRTCRRPSRWPTPARCRARCR